ncbi:MAG: hypothetical protein O3B09_04070 [Proteobacteria bacterium]|nr:hypothetical protein [Pseudomonadota bacterium]
MKSKKTRRLHLKMSLMALITIALLFLLNGVCISGESVKDALIVFCSTMMILTTALFMSYWIDDIKKKN